MAAKAKITRREFMRVTSIAAAGAAVAACQPQTVVVEQTVEVEKEKVVKETVIVETEREVTKIVEKEKEVTKVVEKVVTATPVPKPHEAPDLVELVSTGQLPPLEERMSTNPVVIEPFDEVVEYGGTWRSGMRGGIDSLWLYRILGYQQLVRWNVEWTAIGPNLAESWEINDDSTEYTFYLRRGAKWSDGIDSTADDFIFWHDHIAGDPDVSSPPDSLISEGEFAEIEKADDYTFRFRFKGPMGLVLPEMAGSGGWDMSCNPKHFLSQYHADFGEDAAALAAQEGFDTWLAAFQYHTGDWGARFSAPGRPCLYAWYFPAGYSDTVTLVRAERNPYFYKVDTEGNQLPYIDDIVLPIVQDNEALVMKAINGELDFQDRRIESPQNKALFVDNQEVGGYRLVDKKPSPGNDVIYLNLTHQDPVMREIFQNKDFRIGLSLAINRQDIIDTIAIGQGVPAQCMPVEGQPHYIGPEARTQYTEYDVDMANEYLDKVLPEKDNDGFRLRPDSKRLGFNVEVDAGSTDMIDMMELVVRDWAKVGVEAQVKTEDRTLLYERKEANQHDANVWGLANEMYYIALLDPRGLFPSNAESNWAEAWQYWYTDPDNELAEEPPEHVKEQMSLYDELVTLPDPDQQAELLKQIAEIAKEQFYHIGTYMDTATGYIVVNKNMVNVPEMYSYWQYPTPGPALPEQFGYKD